MYLPISKNRKTPRVLACVLAAGSSSRMGFPKLLAPYLGHDGLGTCLLEHACEVALDSHAFQVAVVTGAHAGKMTPVLESCAGFDQLKRLEKPAGPYSETAQRRLVELRNDAWSQGQSTSVRIAAQHARALDFDAIIFMAADQPFVEAEHLDALIAAFGRIRGTEAPDAAPAPVALRSRCGTRQGNPCLFPRETLPLFETLAGDEGARQLFRSGALAAVPADIPPVIGRDVFCDLDTPEEFARFQKATL